MKLKKLILIIIPFLLIGCTHDMNRREIDEINFVQVMGIDYSEGEYTLSALISSDAGTDPEKGKSGKEEIMEATGKTPYAAFEELKLKSKKSLSVANTGYFLIGDAAATEGIKKCLDFISHDETIKMESLIFVTREMKASDFLNQGIENQQMVHEDLEAVKQKQHDLVTRNDNTLVNILNEMEQVYYSLLVPYLVSEEKAFLIRGYAVFDDLKLADYLDMETSSGVNFIKDIIRVYPVYLEEEASLSLSYSNTKLKSKLDHGRVTVSIMVDFETMVEEVETDKNIYTQDELTRLTDKQNEYIKNIIKKAVDYSTTTGRDILKISQLVENQHVKEWKNLKEGWKAEISEIEYQYVVRSKISKSFILKSGR